MEEEVRGKIVHKRERFKKQPPEEKPEEYFVKIGDKEIPEKQYHPACDQLHKLTARLREEAIQIWTSEYPDLTPEQALARAIREKLPELE